MTEQATVDDRGIHAAVRDVIDRLIDFDEETRRRIIRTAATFFEMDPSRPVAPAVQPGSNQQAINGEREGGFADRAEVSPKDFLFQKSPQTDVERVACLAYYLTHFRDMPHFKNVDISALNTEAAQVKFSSSALTVANATRAGLIVPAGKGFKQLSALGERYVDALPDRDKTREVLSGARTRRRRKSAKNDRESAN
ncbi:MAG: hypothetical protein ACLQNE_16450 [Thermoguttaceae bacterium]